MKNTIIIKLSHYNSLHFPVLARWNIGNVKYTSVFESVDAAKRYFIGRYNSVTFK